MDTNLLNASKTCSKCSVEKKVDAFYKNGKNICRECNNIMRREKYNNDSLFREKILSQVKSYKHNKTILRQEQRIEQQTIIGINNKRCKYCCEIKDKVRFRHNRMKCKDCERDEPTEKLKRYIRTRIYNCLRYKDKCKTKKAIEYLGCSTDDYLQWILNYNPKYSIENNGKEWHIDHVIPISLFDLNNIEEQCIAFNWRNTMPLSCKENLSKNNRINVSQIHTHYNTLLLYHNTHHIEFPKEFENLFAKHIVDGNPLKLSLPLAIGNIC